MQNENRTVLGIFSDITDAKRATDELHGRGILTARLIENEQEITFTGTAEREGASRADSVSGIKGFFARLFGFDDHRSDWKMSSDSESYFKDAYDKKSHLIVVEDCADVALSREIISRMGGVAEEKGSQYYHTESGSLRGLRDRDASLERGRVSSGDQAVDSGLGVDVDRMPFAQTPSNHEVPVSDRISQSNLSGTADRIPFAGQAVGSQESARSGATFAATDAEDDMGSGQTISRDPTLGSGTTVPRPRPFAGEAGDDSLLFSADEVGTEDHATPSDLASDTESKALSGRSSQNEGTAGFGGGVPSSSNSMPFAGQSLNTGVQAAGNQGSAAQRDISVSNGRAVTNDRDLDGISGDADRTPRAGQGAQSSPAKRGGLGSTGDRTRGTSLVGDDRVHDRGVSNADVSRISSDRIMELDDDGQHLVEGDDSGGLRTGSVDGARDTGHILPERSFPPTRGTGPSQPGV